MRTHLTACWRGGDESGTRPGYCLQWRYSEWVHEYLKRVVPAADREWRPETKVWWVAEGRQDALDPDLMPTSEGDS